MSDPIIIIGAGQAGGELALSVRRLGYDKELLLLGGEAHPPYRRPPLSKGFLTGTVDIPGLYISTTEKLESNGIQFRSDTWVEHIDRDNRTVTLSNGQLLRYSQLALATGGRPRALSCPNSDLGNIHYLRTIDDATALRDRFAADRRLVVVGAGYIGLEIAAVAREAGMAVTVLEAADRVMSRSIGNELADFVTRVHRDAGVELRLGQQVRGFAGIDGMVTAVECQNGTLVPADLVLAGIGLQPNTEVAEAAGLAVDGGILVDEQARTSDPNIVAAGDCTNALNGFLSRRVRLESVQNALDQARTAAATLVGAAAPPAAPPSFWSEQYGLKLQMVGLADGADETVVRGSIESKSFALFYLKSGVPQACHLVNRAQDLGVARKLIAERRRVRPADLADETMPLKNLLEGANA